MTMVLAALVWAAAVGAWVFVAGYSALAKWWRSEVGRHMWSFGAMVALLLTLIIVTRVLGRDYPGRDAVRIGCYGLLTFMVWHQVVLLFRIQVRAARARPRLNSRAKETPMTDVITEVGTDAEAVRAAEMQRTLTAAVLAETGTPNVDAAATGATGLAEPDETAGENGEAEGPEVDPDADSEPPVEAPDQVEPPTPEAPAEGDA